LEYTFNNTYPTAARALSNEKALFITTSPVPINTPYIMIEQVNVIDLNANNLLEPGEAAQLAIRLGNIGTENASNVSAILSSIDPYITITQSSSGYGTIPAQSNGLPLTNYGVQVSGSAFNGYQAQFSLQISSTEGNWSYDFSLLINTAILSYGEMYVQEVTGNGNNILDPGETVNLIMPLHNTGGAPSPAGTCTLTSSTAGITINSASSDFAAISGGGTANLSFNIQASSGMVIGTLATMGFHTVAGTSTLTGNFSLEVGAPQEIVVGTGTGSQTYPLDRYYNYSTFEAIYTASELNTIGNIKSIAFNKASGSDTNPIEAVSIYLKHTGDSSLSSGAYNLTGYTQVYSGSFPNNAETGWMEVNLSPMFEYDGSSNLQILIVKAYQAWISNYPYWYATTLASNRARQQRSDQAQPTTLDATTARPNLKIKVYAPAQVLYPPRNLTAYASHQSVGLSWNAPVSGTPTGYKIFKNNALLTSVTTLSYTDLQVVNGTSYTYYLKAVYGTEESDPTETVTATPNLVSPSNLIATAGNAFVTLSWNYSQERSSGERNAAETRLASGFKVYRNSVAIATVSQTYYQDLALVNGTTYTYYVTAIYASPDGESDPSNIVTATPTMPSFAILGTENQITANNYISPINLTYKSNHSQFVYTADELNAAGVFGPVYISQIGFNVASSPSLALVNYLVRIKHTTASNAQGWQTADGLVTVYSADTYMPAAGGWDMLVFQTPFLWNGTDNIVFDTSFGMVSEWSRTGTLEYSNYTNGYRYVVSDSAIQASVFTGGSVNSRRPNLKIALQPLYNGPEILASESSLEFGLCQILSAVSLPLTITNNGDQILSGTITSPDGFTIAVSGQRSAQSSASRSAAIIRNTLSFDLEPDASAEYQITFVPTIAGVVSGDLVIASNAINEPELIIGLSGTGFLPTLNIPVVQISLQESGAVLNWQAIEYATEYRIYRAASPAGEYIQIGTTTNLSFTDPNPVEKAFYRVTA
ncbi:MAG: hypothetical protein PHI68_08230, partial [Candidatus Cloacimonetes bacterium]|nr:hypothetical protein [Candidatus Cloacimonadota bacterium]